MDRSAFRGLLSKCSVSGQQKDSSCASNEVAKILSSLQICKFTAKKLNTGI